METQQKKLPKLTKKQRGFVKDYVATGNGEKAALNNYQIESSNPGNVARSIASENLTKPNIIEAIQKLLPDDFLAEKHRELFDQKRVDYFVFPKSMEDEEIVEHVASVGIKVITVRISDKGKMAFYSITDAQAVKGALEMGYKIKGAFTEQDAPKLPTGNTYNFIFSDEVREKVRVIDAEIKEALTKPHVQKA